MQEVPVVIDHNRTIFGSAGEMNVGKVPKFFMTLLCNTVTILTSAIRHSSDVLHDGLLYRVEASLSDGSYL